MSRVTKLLQEEDGMAGMIQAIILLGLAALIAIFLVVTERWLNHWGQDRMEIILQEDRIPEDSDEDFVPPDWVDPDRF